MRSVVLQATAAIVAIGMAAPSVARAQEPPEALDRIGYVEELEPDTRLIGSGLVMLTIGYGGAVIAAAQSERDVDDKLYIPVAGPWMDLASRGPCRQFQNCDAETANKVLLVADGIFQGLGALQILGGFLFPVKVTMPAETASKPYVQVTPTAGRAGYGLSANGTF